MAHMNVNPIDAIDALPWALAGLFVIVIGWVIWATIDSEPDEQPPPERE